MNQLNSHKVGLTLGGLIAVVHAVWALMVYSGIAKSFMDWIFNLHFLNFQYDTIPFDFGTALTLVIVTGVIGYLMGYVFAWLWNLAHGASHGR